MNTTRLKLARLHNYCTVVTEQALVLSGVSAKELTVMGLRAEDEYGDWETTDKGVWSTASPMYLTRYNLMLADWRPPWPYEILNELGGATVAQFFLAMAYRRAKHAISVMAVPTKGDELATELIDQIACSVVDAAQFLYEAKALMASGDKQLIKLPHDDEPEEAE